MNRLQLDNRMVALKVAMRDTKELLEDFSQGLCDHLSDPSEELRQLKEENAKLRKALAFHYSATNTEWDTFETHCYDIHAAGGTPPDQTRYLSECAIRNWEYHH